MTATGIGIAGPSDIAVRAGTAVAGTGGNAVDAAVAAALAALCTEVGIVGLDAAAYITLRRAGEPPVVIDGGIAMPGLDRPPARFGAAGVPVTLDYGGGMHTLVGHGTVGVGGAVAALGRASAGWGRLEWAQLIEPAARSVAEGFPLSRASRTWLEYSHEAIFGRQAESAAVIHDARGELLPAGATIRVPGLADTLESLALEGPEVFYSGRIGAAIAAFIDAGGGLMGHADRCAYRAVECAPISCDVDDWSIAVPPPPAIGGAALAAMLARMAGLPERNWTPAAVAALAAAQRDVFERLRDFAPAAGDDRYMEELLAWASSGGMPGARRSSSTVHVSTLDDSGLACAVTASSGYGCGLLVPGTGIWLNNCLGEMELNPQGFHALPPGRRMASNMSPCVARGPGGAMLSLGSPGAERITTALLQVILNFMRLGVSLEDALAAPRLHVERVDETWQAAVEPGLPLDEVAMPCRRFDELSMFFGGAGAVLLDADGSLVAAADPRRQGGAVVVSADAG
ncbi:gamma-glutamyltransferase [Wenzhouxiangella sp. XN24]|uniref:gamma-glutamyltransferase n=1 Tax=Wenzhouxiangella sp. XN24 TaxID=2713569 RepID=UPI0013EBB395|nr:gamma-glutamyltransferase [Wenzhouxiangella sp. XN24]NGX15744.1 gamma-glutamyltransferase [Wenzhouxiangella sp. XN24]